MAVKSEFLDEFIKDYHPKIKFPYILLTLTSDLEVGNKTEHLTLLNDSKVIKWYGCNAVGRLVKNLVL